MTRAHTIATASGITGFTLPGMMLLPACSAGSRISANPETGPLFIHRRSFADLHQRHGGGLEMAAELDRGILAAERCEVIGSRDKRKTGLARQAAQPRGRRIPDARSRPCRPQCRPIARRASRGSADSTSRDGIENLLPPAAEFLAHPNAAARPSDACARSSPRGRASPPSLRCFRQSARAPAAGCDVTSRYALRWIAVGITSLLLCPS